MTKRLVASTALSALLLLAPWAARASEPEIVARAAAPGKPASLPVEVPQKDVVFLGVAAPAVVRDVSMTHTFSQKHPKLDVPGQLIPEVKAIEVTLTAKTGITSFDFIHYLRLSMSDQADSTNAIELINYEKDTTQATGPILIMPSANPVNALAQWKTDAAVFTVDVAGDLPESDWTADVTVRFAGKVTYQR